MNSTQAQATPAALVGFLAGLLAGKGVFGLDAATWAIVLGAVVTFATTIWTVIITRKAGLVTQVANMPEVKSVVVAPTQAGAALAQVTPENVKVG